MKFIEFLRSIPMAVWYSLSLVAVIIGDYAAKMWSIQPKWSVFGVVALGYMLSGIFYLPTLLKEGLIITATIWMILNIAGFVIVGYFIFGERLGLVQTIGILIGIIAIILLSFPSQS